MNPALAIKTGAGKADAPRHEAHGRPAPLGNNADFTSPPPIDHHLVCPPPATVKSWHLRSLGREIMKNHGVSRRMRWCGSKISPGKDGVGLYARPDRPYGRLHGVCVCGQSICCPVCAPRIAAFRAAEVATAYQRALDAGWAVSLETFTKPHHLDRRPGALEREFKQFSGLWRRYQDGKKAFKREADAEGAHIAREITWGDLNGWHYHHHRLRYDRPDTFDQQKARADWLGVLNGAGYESEHLERYAYDFGAVGDEAGARYVAKMSTSVEASARAIGSELASSATKGRNINTLLAHHAAGDLQAGATWLNGVCDVTANKVSSVRWSPRLRWKLGLDGTKSDEDIAAEEALPSDVFLGALTPHQWTGVLRWRAEFPLVIAANKGLDAVNEFLAGLELGQLNEDSPVPVWTRDTGESKNQIQPC